MPKEFTRGRRPSISVPRLYRGGVEGIQMRKTGCHIESDLNAAGGLQTIAPFFTLSFTSLRLHSPALLRLVSSCSFRSFHVSLPWSRPCVLARNFITVLTFIWGFAVYVPATLLGLRCYGKGRVLVHDVPILTLSQYALSGIIPRDKSSIIVLPPNHGTKNREAATHLRTQSINTSTRITSKTVDFWKCQVSRWIKTAWSEWMTEKLCYTQSNTCETIQPVIIIVYVHGLINDQV